MSPFPRRARNVGHEVDGSLYAKSSVEWHAHIVAAGRSLLSVSQELGLLVQRS